MNSIDPDDTASRWRASLRPPTSASNFGRRPCPWLDSAFFLLAWLPTALAAFYLKWYTMTALGGFAKATHTGGYVSLSSGKRLSFFDGEIFIGLLAIPLLLLLINRLLITGFRLKRGQHPPASASRSHLGLCAAAALTAVFSIAYLLLFAIQFSAQQQTGRYISLQLIRLAIDYGIHEPGAATYLSARGLAGLAVIIVAIIAAAIFAARRAAGAPSYSVNTLRALRLAGECWLLFIAIVLAAGWHTSEFRTPYHESTYTRALLSLWREKAVDTGEFADFNPDRMKQLNFEKPQNISAADLIARYREISNAPAPFSDPRYFGKESGDNVIFFVLETLPDEFLPVDDPMIEFPNLRRLREHSFVAERHYATFPFTQCALFSVFSSWYPLDTLHHIWEFPPDEAAPTFLAQLNSAGYQTASFSPLPVLNNTDDAVYRAVAFQQQIHLEPNETLPAVGGVPAWQAHRIAADLSALDKLKASMNQWLTAKQPFVAAFLPQLGHFPYTENWDDEKEDQIRSNGRAVLAREDAWLGQLTELLEQHHQLDHTIIVIFGDHGRRNIKENPNLRRGTVDETAFHVPLLIYAPHALDHAEHIAQLTSHIDIAPTVLDLLGIQRDEQTEQGAAIWNPGISRRTTFFFSQPLFGADGFYSQLDSKDRFFMWHYFSDMVYENSRASFDDSNYVVRGSPIDQQIREKLRTMVNLQFVWESKFAQPQSSSAGH